MAKDIKERKIPMAIEHNEHFYFLDSNSLSRICSKTGVSTKLIYQSSYVGSLVLYNALATMQDDVALTIRNVDGYRRVMNVVSERTFFSSAIPLVKEMQKNNLLPFRYAKMGRWIGKTTVRDNSTKNGLRLADTEIDLLGIGKDNAEYLVGECKFKNSPFTYSEYLDTKAKLTPLKEKAEFYYALFSESGFDENVINEAEKDKRIQLYEMATIVNFKK